MASKLTNFLIRLAEGPQTLTEFQRSPEQAIKRADLSSAETTVLISRNPSVIRAAIANDIGSKEDDAAGIIVIVLEWVRSIEASIGKAAIFNRLAGIKEIAD